MGVLLSPGDCVRDYTIIAHAGHGGEGNIYKARSKTCTVALKQSHVGRGHPQYPLLAERAERLKRLIGLALPPSFCSVLEIFEHEGLIYVVMDWVDGHNLQQHLAHSGPLAPSALAPLAQDLFAALDALHRQAIVHRDVKPTNIVQQDRGGELHGILVDPGIALHHSMPRLTRPDMLVATPEYAAPEVIEGHSAAIDGRADVYSAGATLFEALTGRCPFEAASEIELIRAICAPVRPSIRRVRPELPEALDLCLQYFLAIKPDDRPASARHAADALQKALDGKATAPAVSAPPPAAPAAPSRACTLAIESGAYAGRVLDIPRSGITLGRATLNPGDTLLSRCHFRAKPTRRGLRMRDLGSANGLLYGGRRVRTVDLQPGDTLIAGVTQLRRM